MIREYLRPKTLEEALRLLAEQAQARPLAGGMVLTATQEDVIAVDLQNLGLDAIRREGAEWVLGATATLQEVYEHEALPKAIRELVHREFPYPQRDQATVAGALVAADGRSIWATGLMALDARLVLHRWGQEPQTVPIGDWLPLRHEWHPGWLITEVRVSTAPRLAWEGVARSPADRPLLMAAVARWPRGRTRVVLGGWGDAPHLALDGPTADGADIAARNAAYDAQDHLASAEYRREVAPILVRRCLAKLEDPDE